MFGQPVRISLEQQREVVEFVLQLAVAGQAGGEGAEFGRGEMVLLQFAEQPAQLLGEPGRRALRWNNFNSSSYCINKARKTITRPSSVSRRGGSDLQFFEYELCEPLE